MPFGQGGEDIRGGLIEPILGGLIETIGFIRDNGGLSSILDNIGDLSSIDERTRFCNPIIVGLISGLYLS
jgi:hypothetical protein